MESSEDQDPVVDSDRIEAVYQSLNKMKVHLDDDPLSYGPKRINSKISECREHLTRCNELFNAVSRDLHLYKRKHRVAETALKMQVRDLMANDPVIRAGRSIADREAMAYIKLSEQSNQVDKYSVVIGDLENVLSVIKANRSDLKDIQSRLRDQIKVCQEELTTGSHWGTRSTIKPAFIPSDTPSTPPPVVAVHKDESNIEEILGLDMIQESVPPVGEVPVVFAPEVKTEVFPVPEVSIEELIGNAPVPVVEDTSVQSRIEVEVMISGVPRKSTEVEGIKGNSDYSDDFLGAMDVSQPPPRVAPPVMPNISDDIDIDSLLG